MMQNLSLTNFVNFANAIKIESISKNENTSKGKTQNIFDKQANSTSFSDQIGMNLKHAVLADEENIVPNRTDPDDNLNSLKDKLKTDHPSFGTAYKNNITLVGVHVRRTDHADEYAKKFGYNAAPISYFEKAMKYFIQNFQRPVFLFSSDDKQFVLKNIMSMCDQQWLMGNNSNKTFAETVSKMTNVKQKKDKMSTTTSKSQPIVRGAVCEFIGGNDYATDFLALSSLDHTIMSTGTFGWWIGWLAGGRVVYYKDHVVKGSVLETYVDSNDLFPPYWLPM